MKEYKIEQIRNLGLVGHGTCGKTALAEAMAFAAGVTSRLGSVDDGNTLSDYTEQEINRKISISASMLNFEYKNTKFNVIDMPGYADFIGEVVGGLAVADIACIVVDALGGIEIGTEMAARYADKYEKPRCFVINKIDKEHAEFDSRVSMLQERFGHQVIPVTIPIGEGLGFKGVVDLITKKAYSFDDKGKVSEIDIPGDLSGTVDEAHDKLVENVAESDDALLEKFFDAGELSPEEIQDGLKKGIVGGAVIPVFVTSATTMAGVPTLLEFATKYFPSPADFGEIKGFKPNSDEEMSRPVSEGAPPVIFIFKTVSESHVGELLFFRVMTGKVAPGDDLAIARDVKSSEKIAQIYQVNGKNRNEIKQVKAGDMGAFVKLRGTHTGDTLTAKSDPMEMPALEFPEPVIDVGFSPAAKGDEEKVAAGLTKLKAEDPTFLTKVDPEIKQTLLFAQGELQLDIIFDKLKKRFGVEVVTSKPKIPYRETIKGKAEVQHKYKKQTGGKGQYGDVHIRMSPNARGEGFEFLDEITGGVIPAKFIPSVEKGIVESMEEGALAGYKVVDVKVALFYGSYHTVDSSDMAFKIAGSMAFKEAFMKCDPVLLEPIYNLEVIVPDDYTGDIMGDVSSRRGKIQGMEPEGPNQRIKARVPQAELYKYSTSLRSMTQGRGFYTRSFSHYEEVPREITEKIIEEAKQMKEQS
ncbi:MAG: elongation factor G [candidate division Zixibacteria bacterium]|nr:elongation factor G [candidate division Zixibacteria bacterium]